MGQETSNTSTGGSAPPVSNQPLDLLSDLESRLGQLKDWQHQTDQQLREMQEESKRIEILREEAHEMQRACEERQRALDEQVEQLNSDKETLAAKQQQLDQEQGELGQERSALDTARQEIEEERHRAQADRDELTHQHDELAKLQQDMQARLSDLAAKEADLSMRMDEAHQQQAELNEQQQAIQAERDALSQERETLQHWQNEIDEVRTQLDADRAELAKERGAADHARKQLVADQATVKQQQEELTEQKKQVERVKLELKLKSESLQAQQQHLEQAREELVEQAMKVPADADEKLAELQQAKAELEQAKLELESRHDEIQAAMVKLDVRDQELLNRQNELDDTQAKLEQTRFELGEREQALQTSHVEQGEQSETFAARLQAIEERERALAEHEAQAKLQSSDDKEQARDLDRRLAEYEHKRAELEKKREQFKQTLEHSRQQIEAERAEAHRREAELEARVKELELNTAHPAPAAHAETDQAIQRRRAKLHRYRDLLRERSKALQDEELKIQSSSQQFTGLDKERQMLVEVKRFLEASEGEMVKRWATGRAASLVMGAVVTLLLAAGASLLAANQVVQPKWEASMMISVGTPENQAPPTTAEFLADFRETLFSEPVLKAAMIEMDKADANVRIASSPQQLKSYLQDHLEIAGVPGRADLALRGEDKQLLQPALASLGKAIVGFNAAQDYQAKREPSTRIAMPAKLVDLPAGDSTQQKFTIAGATFGGIVFLALLAYITLRIMLGRSKRMFGDDVEELTILDKPETWSPLHAASKRANG